MGTLVEAPTTEPLSRYTERCGPSTSRTTISPVHADCAATAITSQMAPGTRSSPAIRSVAPASRTIRTTRTELVPRTIESSISTTRLPSSSERTGFNLSLTPKSRTLWLGSINVRPT